MQVGDWSTKDYRAKLEKYHLLFPLTDAFGTRLDPNWIEQNLLAFGLRSFSIEIHDECWILHHPEQDRSSDSVSMAATWLRGQLSPLLPIKLVPEQLSQSLESETCFHERRTCDLDCITLVEMWDEGES